MSVKNYKQGGSLEDEAVYLNHDLAMLRIIETFSESAPQIVLMLTITLQQGQLDLITVLKTIGSMSAVALCVTSYHRSLRSFLPNAAEPSIVSSIFYFIWNWFLLISRLVTLSLFASVLPCFLFAHFFTSWLVLFFFSWRAQTHFMDSAFGEWLYRATVGLIWYFDWFNVVEGNTRNRTFLYHTYILVDNSILLGVWCGMMITDPPYFVVPQLYAIIIAASVFAVYAIGLFFKVLYYKCFHPNVQKQELKGYTEQIQEFPDTVDSPPNMMMLRAFSHHTDGKEKDRPVQPAPCNKRMKMLAENFYS
ncbi:XK-related protein 8 isoform X2 [Nothobranchius furzeri]|nr:XK-related protein 8 isoform X2 [Nothobranchius furzeri]KAF7210722.1 transcript variant X2 [Nothobranchius furzeri]